MFEGFLSLFTSGPQFNENQRLEKLRNQLITCTYYNKYHISHKQYQVFDITNLYGLDEVQSKPQHINSRIQYFFTKAV